MSNRRAVRRDQTRAEIVAAAWELVRRDGLAGLAMRELGERVGMRAQSLYSYFASKHEIFDAMFLEGYRAFEAELRSVVEAAVPDPAERARLFARRFIAFCTADPPRYQLLFQRTIPDFVPSADSYAVAESVIEAAAVALAEVGLGTPEAVDLWSAVLTGLANQQIANDPGGDRWERLADRAADMLRREFPP